MASTYLSRTGISGANQKKWTFSGWFKKSSNGSELRLLTSSNNSSYDDSIRFKSADKIEVVFNNAIALTTNRLFRDTNAYYHIVVKVDTDQASANDRIVLYINGVDERTVGGYSTDSMPNQGVTGYINYNAFYIGVTNPTANSNHFNGIMSHVHFTDGYAYDASAFGETDSTTGEWKIKTSPSVSYGTTGFWILKDGNSVTDSSPNSNTFTVSAGTLTKTEDNPSSVFATINPLFVNDDAATNALTKGNNTYTSTTRGEWNNMTSTLGAVTGKYYWEVKYEQLIDASTIYMSSEGVASDLAPANHNLGEGSRSGYGYGWLCGNRNTTSNTRYLKTVNGTATLTTDSNNTPVSAGDIVGVAWDATNGKLWFHKNGTYIDDTSGNVGNPTTAAYPYHTGMQTGILYTVWSDVWQNASGSLLIKSYNFGNGYFGTTAVSSAGTNASGNGIFEYDVPTGYTALSTKGLNL